MSELAGGGADRTPADTYKRAVRQVTGGMEAEVERNSARVRELREQLRELDRELLAADDRRLLVRIAANLAWEDTLEALWVESWITMRPFPRPDRFAKAVDPAEVMALAAEIERRAAELVAAVRGRRR